MTEKLKSLGELELTVLKTVWEKPGISVQEAAGILGEQRGCARTTVLTVMQRLHAKGFLKRKKVKGIYRFSATQGRGKVMSGLIDQFVDKVLGGTAAPFLAYLADTKSLTGTQAKQLRAIVKALEDNEREE